MTEYRLAKPEEWEDCIELANYVFSMAHRPHDFEQLIPRVYQAGPEMARIHRVAVAENGRLRAEIAVLPQQMAAGDSMKLDSLVIAHQPRRGEYVPGPCTHRPSSHGSRGYLKCVTARSALG